MYVFHTTGLMVAEITLMFQYVACKINNIPYGVKNIHTYSEEKIENLRQSDELIMFIRPADWMQFQTPNGLYFRSINNTRGKAISATMDKLDAMKEFREDEIFELLNQQYANMELQEPKEVRENSIVLIRNIGNEPKREPLKFARVERIHKSRDNAQRVVTLTYNNIRMNKNGDWIGTPVTVDRSVNDLVLVDNALNDSMLSSRVTAKKDELCEREKIAKDDEISKDDIVTVDEAPEITNPEINGTHNNDIINTVEEDDNSKEANKDHEPETTTDKNDEDKDRPGIKV